MVNSCKHTGKPVQFVVAKKKLFVLAYRKYSKLWNTNQDYVGTNMILAELNMIVVFKQGSKIRPDSKVLFEGLVFFF